MHLSRLRLEPHNQQARRDLASPYDMHRTLTRCFARSVDDNVPRFLWRAEPTTNWTEAVVLVQSSEVPDWEPLAANRGYLRAAPETRSLVLTDWLHRSASCRFRLFANPTVTRGGKRYGLASEDAQLDWLSRQAAKAGFSVEAALVTASDLVRARKADMSISLQRACFEGRLAIKDVDALSAAVRNGIGPAKAFGFGLLSLARL